MVRTAHALVAVAVLSFGTKALAQVPTGQARADAGAPPIAQTTADWGPLTPDLTPPAWAVPPARPGPLEDRNGPLLKGDPLLDAPPHAPPGWFAAASVDPVGPHVTNRLAAAVTAGATTDVVQPGGADLGWTVAPRLEAGYRFSEGAGAILAGYRFVEASGTGTTAPLGLLGATGTLHSRLDLNAISADYASREFSLGPSWDMKWLVGVRIATVFFDSEASAAGLEQHASNHFAGAGPEAGLELWRGLGNAGLSLFGRADTSLLVGRVHQSFSETVGAATGETTQEQFDGVPVLGLQAGLGWRPCACPSLRFVGGYTFERWWAVGNVRSSIGTGPSSHADVTVQGVFVRGEWRY